MQNEPLYPGDRLQDRYTVTHIHHLSGLSALYVARDDQASDHAQPYAIKETIIQNDVGQQSSRAIDEFINKAKLLIELDHPSISKTFDYFVVQKRTYLVMEFIEGKDLEAVLLDAREPFPVDEVHRWAIALCDVLKYLHTFKPAPIIYRDLKPANIIVTPQRQARLIDFGIAVVLSDTQTYEPLGTDGYAAPEQYNGEVSPAIDIYALGATLHHLLTRRDPRIEPPFSFDRRPIHEINSSVPEVFEEIIARALSHSPQDRFFSAAAMLTALKQVAIN